MIHIGDNAKCPQCTRMGRIVWISQNGDTMGIKCAASHIIDQQPNSFGFTHAPSKAHKNSVFLVKTEKQ